MSASTGSGQAVAWAHVKKVPIALIVTEEDAFDSGPSTTSDKSTYIAASSMNDRDFVDSCEGPPRLKPRPRPTGFFLSRRNAALPLRWRGGRTSTSV